MCLPLTPMMAENLFYIELYRKTQTLYVNRPLGNTGGIRSLYSELAIGLETSHRFRSGSGADISDVLNQHEMDLTEKRWG